MSTYTSTIHPRNNIGYHNIFRLRIIIKNRGYLRGCMGFLAGFQIIINRNTQKPHGIHSQDIFQTRLRESSSDLVKSKTSYSNSADASTMTLHDQRKRASKPSSNNLKASQMAPPNNLRASHMAPPNNLKASQMGSPPEAFPAKQIGMGSKAGNSIQSSSRSEHTRTVATGAAKSAKRADDGRSEMSGAKRIRVSTNPSSVLHPHSSKTSAQPQKTMDRTIKHHSALITDNDGVRSWNSKPQNSPYFSRVTAKTPLTLPLGRASPHYTPTCQEFTTSQENPRMLTTKTAAPPAVSRASGNRTVLGNLSMNASNRQTARTSHHATHNDTALLSKSVSTKRAAPTTISGDGRQHHGSAGDATPYNSSTFLAALKNSEEVLRAAMAKRAKNEAARLVVVARRKEEAARVAAEEKQQQEADRATEELLKAGREKQELKPLKQKFQAEVNKIRKKQARQDRSYSTEIARPELTLASVRARRTGNKNKYATKLMEGFPQLTPSPPPPPAPKKQSKAGTTASKSSAKISKSRKTRTSKKD